MEGKKRKIAAQSSKQSSQIDPNEVLADLGMDDFLKALTKDKKKKLLKKIQANLMQLALEEVDGDDPLAVLKIKCENIHKKFLLLGEMLGKRIKPNKRGICGFGNDISVIVDDKLMDKAWELLINMEDWNEQVKIKKMKTFPWTEGVVHRKLRTKSEEKMKELLKFIGIDDPHHFMKKTYFARVDQKRPFYHPITNELDYVNIFDLIRKKDALMEKLWHREVPAKVIQTVILLGDYVVPGTVCSDKAKPKRSRCAYFTIEWKEKVFPESRKGILSINCRYMTLADGRLFNN